MTVGVITILQIPFAYVRTAWSEHRSLTQPLTRIEAKKTIVSNQLATNALYPKSAPSGKLPADGALIGHITITKLKLLAPLVEGTSLHILAASAGHLNTSVLPGEVGTTVLAAHDVTYFHHIDELQRGDIITVTTSQGTFDYQVTSHAVIHVGDNVNNTGYPSLVLETCYPLNALTLVNSRYVVYANLLASHLN